MESGKNLRNAAEFSREPGGSEATRRQRKHEMLVTFMTHVQKKEGKAAPIKTLLTKMMSLFV